MQSKYFFLNLSVPTSVHISVLHPSKPAQAACCAFLLQQINDSCTLTHYLLCSK